MSWWDAFIAWVEVNPWRIGIALAVIAVPITAVVSAASRTFRRGLVLFAKWIRASLWRFWAFARTVRLTTTTRIDARYAEQRESEELEEQPDPEFEPTVEPPHWRLTRGTSRGVWLLTNNTGEKCRVIGLDFLGNNFSLSQYPTLPRFIKEEQSLRFSGNIIASDIPMIQGRPRVVLKWEDAHEDQHSAESEIYDGSYLVEFIF